MCIMASQNCLNVRLLTNFLYLLYQFFAHWWIDCFWRVTGLTKLPFCWIPWIYIFSLFFDESNAFCMHYGLTKLVWCLILADFFDIVPSLYFIKCVFLFVCLMVSHKKNGHSEANRHLVTFLSVGIRCGWEVLSRGRELTSLLWTWDRDWTLDSGGMMASEGCREPEGVMWVKGLTLRGGKTRKPTLMAEVIYSVLR